MKMMLKRFRSNEEGLDLVQLLIAVVILGFLIGIVVLVLIGKVDDARKNAADASVAKAVTAAKVVVSEGLPQGSTYPAEITKLLGGAVGPDDGIRVVQMHPNSPTILIYIAGAEGAYAGVRVDTGRVNINKARD